MSQVHRFPHYQCANAVGAAIAQISSVIDTVRETTGYTLVELRNQVEEETIQNAIRSGAESSSVKIISAEVLPVAYIAGKCRFIIKAAGDWDGTDGGQDAEASQPNGFSVDDSDTSTTDTLLNAQLGGKDESTITAKDILAYKPCVKDRRWHISELDTEFLAIGNYCLGCGGGGDPETSRIALIDMLRGGATATVMDINDVSSDLLCAWGGMMGSPEVGSERLLGNEYIDATEALLEFLKVSRCDSLSRQFEAKALQIGRSQLAGMIANEIGGSNGLVSVGLPSLVQVADEAYPELSS